MDLSLQIGLNHMYNCFYSQSANENNINYNRTFVMHELRILVAVFVNVNDLYSLNSILSLGDICTGK